MTWYDPEELVEQANAGQVQPEFDPPATEADPEDTSNEAMEALLARDVVIQAAIAGITQSYPTVSSDAAWADPGPPPVADFSGTPLDGGVPLEVTFTDLSTVSPTAWLWDFGDGNESTSQHPVHTYTVGGTYTVSLTATNAGGEDTETKVGYMVPSAVDPDLSAWYDASDTDSLTVVANELTLWADLTATGADLVGDATNPPAYGLGRTINSIEVPDFSANDIMKTAAEHVLVKADDGAFTFMMVIHYDATGGTRYIVSQTDTSSTRGPNYNWIGGGRCRAHAAVGSGNALDIMGTSSPGTARAVIVVARANITPELEVWVDSVTDGATVGGAPWNTTAKVLGLGGKPADAVGLLDGGVAELKIWSKALSDEDLATEEAALAAKWAVTI